MKNTKKILIKILASMLFIYLFAAFIQWDLNAGNWDATQRAAVALLGGMIGVLACIPDMREVFY